VAKWVEDGPADLRDRIAAKFDVHLHECSVGKLLKKLNFSSMSGRPVHPQSDLEAQQALKTYGPPRLQAILRSGLVSLRQRIRSQDHRPGQDGDPRVPVLIKLSASKRHFLNQDSRTPVDCQAISLPPPANIVGFAFRERFAYSIMQAPSHWD
jgi:hypothetical protein